MERGEGRRRPRRARRCGHGGLLLAATFPQSELAGFAEAGAIVTGVLLLVFTPITGTAMGFVAGAVAAFLANLALGFAGGLELDLDPE